MTIDDLPIGQTARVMSLAQPTQTDHDAQEICDRLREIGFLADERVTVRARLRGGEPMVVRIGQSRFALRRHEAQLVNVATHPAEQSGLRTSCTSTNGAS